MTISTFSPEGAWLCRMKPSGLAAPFWRPSRGTAQGISWEFRGDLLLISWDLMGIQREFHGIS